MRLWSTSAWTGSLAVTFVLSAAGAYAQDGDLMPRARACTRRPRTTTRWRC
jgi:hypothetical protein